MNGFLFTISEDGWLSWSLGEDHSRFVTPTTASAEEWRRRLVDAGLFQPHPDSFIHPGELVPIGNRYSCRNYKRMEEDLIALAGYYTNRGNPTDDFRDGIQDNNMEHLPYAALAWIDHEIREEAADHARCEVNWQGEIDGDIHKKAAAIIREGHKRFAHENPACSTAAIDPHADYCTPGETRLYAFGDFDEAPIPLCRACFHRQLSRDGEITARDKLTLVDGALVADAWQDARIATCDRDPTPAPAATDPALPTDRAP